MKVRRCYSYIWLILLALTPVIEAASFEWSPNGRKVGYLVGSEFRTVDADSGRRESTRIALNAMRFQWAPDASAVLLEDTQTLAWLDLKDGKWRTLLSNRSITDPKISPDGRSISFVSQHNIWLVDLTSGKIRMLTRGGTEEQRKGEADWLYSHSFDLHTGYWWAPDSSAIAFLELDERHVSKLGDVRYPRAGSANPAIHVSTIGLQNGHVSRMTTGADEDGYLPRVAWLPDSRHLAIQRLNRSQTMLQLLIADGATGVSRTVLTEQDPYWLNVHDDLRFVNHGEQFLWSSERSGYRHLYLYDMQGKLIRQLTSGSWEVSAINAVDEKRGVVYFTATEKTPLERHLYRIGLDGSGFARMTGEEGWHDVRFSPAGNAYVDSYSSISMPPIVRIVRVDGSSVTALDSLQARPEIVSMPEFFTIKTHDGELLNAMLIKPPQLVPGHKYPVIVYIKGGPGEQAVRNAWDEDVFLWHQQMAKRGFLIFALDNRGSAGRGHLFEEPIHCRFGAQEISDQRDGIAWLRLQPYVDASRIGIWGSGYGGHMTLHALFEDPQDFKVGFAQAPVADWSLADTAFSERYLQVPRGFSEQFDESSPIKNAAGLRGKLLIAAPRQESVETPGVPELLAELDKAGKHVDFVAIARGESQTEILRRATSFFVENLRPAQDNASLQ
jgi:dipeptidyl-peptidase-4